MDMKIVTTGGADASVRLILQEKVHTKAAVDVSRGQGESFESYSAWGNNSPGVGLGVAVREPMMIKNNAKMWNFYWL